MLIWESMPQSTAYQHEEGRGLTASTLLFALIHRSAWNINSRKFISSMLHNPTPTGPVAPL
jgi:hypothetical protein